MSDNIFINEAMALEKYIRGKVDDAHHDGKYANQKRLEESILMLAEGEQVYASWRIWQSRDKWISMGDEFLNYHRGILEDYGLIENGEAVGF